MSPWRAALDAHPELWAFTAWPVIEMDTLPLVARRTFQMQRQIVVAVLKGAPLKQVAQAVNRSPGAVTQLLNRCFSTINGEYALTQALIPYSRVKGHTRTAPLPSLDTPQSGAAGALTHLFAEAPQVKERLDHILQKRIADDPHSGPVSSATFHGFFKQLLGEVGWPTERWPYTSLDVGRESLRRYMIKRTAELRFMTRSIQKQHLEAYRLAKSQAQQRLFGRVEVDGHEIDFMGRLDICLNDHLLSLRLARAWLYCAIDVATDCVLGYVVLDKKQPSRWDVLRLFAHCQRPWTPMPLTTPGLQYEPGACFPSGLSERPAMIFQQVALDNAWAHHAHAVENLLVKRQGSTVQMGFAGQPRDRNWIEHTFALINQNLSHRLPATTGSTVTDPKRESRHNAKRPPRFTWRQFLEALEIVLTQHNLRKQAGRLGGAAPLDLVRAKLAAQWTPYVSDTLRDALSPFEQKQRLPVKSRTDSEARHLNFHGVKYTCSALATLQYADKELEVIYDFRDLRTLRAYTLQGRFLGHVHAPRSWQHYAHSIDTRHFILAQVKTDHLRAPDLLSKVLLDMVEKSAKPLYAQHALRLYTEFEADQERIVQLGGDPPTSVEAPTTVARAPSTVANQYRWSMHEADHDDTEPC